MSTYKKRINFVDSDEGVEVRQALVIMYKDPTYFTDASYSANNVLHPDNTITFVEKHMTYLNSHPSVEPTMYLANLRLITRIR